MIGTTLSHYRILEKLGAGGMGVVYRAEDTNLNRQVAIKVLPEAFAEDPERMARFEREAKLLASLNHSNIAAIHGLEEAEGKRFIVMELADGETLARRISRGPLPVDEALEICRQIAEGLEAAHEKGIIHRDLKPSNVMVSTDSKVKILDFGLARAMAGEVTIADPSHSPTITETMTRPGVVLGTAAYMSPEQARGKPVDKRADIWAFGCILYECLTGRRAFEGDTVTETLAAILKGEPDWHELPASTSRRITELLTKCLRKEHRERLHDIGDARLEIEGAKVQAGAPGALTPAYSGLEWNVGIPLMFLVLAAGVVLGRLVVWKPGHSPTPEVIRLSTGVEPASRLAGGLLGWEDTTGGHPSRAAFALTPNGRLLIYYGLAPNGNTQLYTRKWDRPGASPIPGTEGAYFPFLSPDGKWIGFFAWSGFSAPCRIMKLSVEGGTPITICEFPKAGGPCGASWGSQDIIVFSFQNRLWKVRASGGVPEAISDPDIRQGELAHILPHLLPDGDALLFSTVNSPNTSWDNPTVEVITLSTGKRKLLLEEGADARYVPTGHLVFARRGKLYAIRFDVDRLEVAGEATVVIESVMQAMNSQVAGVDSFAGQYSFSDSGTLAFVPGGIFPDPQHNLDWVDRKGSITRAADATPPYYFMRLSPNGKRVVYCTLATLCNIWLLDLERGTNTQLTFGGADMHPVWTPDGKNVTYASYGKKAPARIMQVSAAGGQPKVLVECSFGQDCSPADWSPDGKHMVYVRTENNNQDILILHAEDGKTEEFLKTPYNEAWPDLAPDGRWMAYASDETGRTEVYVRPFPGPGDKYTLSTAGGDSPAWNTDGGELFYCQRGETTKDIEIVMAVDIVTKADFVAGKPHPLFKFSFFGLGANPRSYDTHGQRFLIAEWKDPMTVQPVTQINIVLNWFEELKRLVPTGK